MLIGQVDGTVTFLLEGFRTEFALESHVRILEMLLFKMTACIADFREGFSTGQAQCTATLSSNHAGHLRKLVLILQVCKNASFVLWINLHDRFHGFHGETVIPGQVIVAVTL